MARNPITWTAGQRKALSTAVRKYNAAVTRMQKSNKFTVLPNKTSVDREMGLIETRDELRQRVKELESILISNNPNANDIAFIGQEVAPKYLANEMKLALKTINERRAKQRRQLFSDDAMEAFEYARKVANKNLHQLHEQNYVNGDDFDDLLEEKYPNTFKYAETYKQVWIQYNGDATIPDIIDWFAMHEPDELALIFESGADEVDVHYIYPMSADKTPVIIRHNNILRFWNAQYRKFKTVDFVGYENDKYKE